MKRNRKIAVGVLITIAALFIGLIVYCGIHVVQAKDQERQRLLTEQQILQQEAHSGQINYLYAGAIIIGLTGGYFLFRSDMRAIKTNQQIQMNTRQSRRD